MTFDVDLGVMQNVVLYPLQHVTYAAAKFEVAMSNSLGGDAFTRKNIIWLDLGVKVTQDVALYPLHHVAYVHEQFEVATSKGLGGDALTRKFIIWGSGWGIMISE